MVWIVIRLNFTAGGRKSSRVMDLYFSFCKVHSDALVPIAFFHIMIMILTDLYWHIASCSCTCLLEVTQPCCLQVQQLWAGATVPPLEGGGQGRGDASVAAQHWGRGQSTEPVKVGSTLYLASSCLALIREQMGLRLLPTEAMCVKACSGLRLRGPPR